MMKTLIASAIVIALMSGAASADAPSTATPAPATARPAAESLDVTIVVSTGTQPRQYVMKMLSGDDCSSVSSKTAGKLEDQIRLCATAGSQIKLNIDWFTRDGAREVHSKSTLLAKRGATFHIEGDGAKLTVTMK